MTDPISNDRLASFFAPRSIALIGASDKSRFSTTLFSNLSSFGLAAQTVLVNRKGGEVHGKQALRSLSELTSPVDIAFVMVPQSGVLEAMSDAAAAGIKNASIMTSGYGENGEAGRVAEAELLAHAQALDMVILGPNQLGFINFTKGIPVAAVPRLPSTSGGVALLSQSGAAAGSMVDFATLTGIGLSHFITLGNELMLSAGRLLDFLVDDDDTQAIALFLETIRDPEVFAAAARRAAVAGKTVVALKVGSSELAAATAAAHTGALVGDDRTTRAIFAELGIIRVDTIEDLILTAGAAAAIGELPRPGIGIVSISGGACDIVADRADDANAEIPKLAEATKSELRTFLPEFGSVNNPLDVTGAALGDPTIFTRSIKTISDDPGVGVVAVINALPWIEEGRPNPRQHVQDAIGQGMQTASVPSIYVTQTVQPVSAYTKEILDAAGIRFVLPGLQQATLAMGRLGWWSSRRRELLRQEPQAPSRSTTVPAAIGGVLSEAEGRDLLQTFGIPVVPTVVATSAGEAREAAERFGGRVAAKIVSPDILHKSDIGGVRLDVGVDDVEAAFHEVIDAGRKVAGARVDGVMISPMVGAGAELLVGIVRDEQWGPMLAIAIGGIFVEILNDSALASVPVSPHRVKEMLKSLKGFGLLDGARGVVPADLDSLSRTIADIGDLAVQLGDQLEGLEINPLWVSGTEIYALDAAITLAPLSGSARGHQTEPVSSGAKDTP